MAGFGELLGEALATGAACEWDGSFWKTRGEYSNFLPGLAQGPGTRAGSRSASGARLSLCLQQHLGTRNG